MKKQKLIAGILTSVVLMTPLSGCAGIARQTTETAVETLDTEPSTVQTGPVRPQDDFYRYVNGETLDNAQFEYGNDSAARAFNPYGVYDIMSDLVEGVVAGSGYETGTEEYIIQNAYNSYLAYDIANAGVPDDLDSLLHEIDEASSVDELLMIDARAVRDYSTAGFTRIGVDVCYTESTPWLLTFPQFSSFFSVDYTTVEDSYSPFDDLKEYASDLMEAMGHDSEEADETGLQLGLIAMILSSWQASMTYSRKRTLKRSRHGRCASLLKFTALLSTADMISLFLIHRH